MKILKLVGIGIGVIVALFLIVAAFLPTEFSVSRSIEINQPSTKVYGITSDYNTFVTWSPWIEMEPSAKVTVTGDPSTVGHYYAWEGKEVGSGSMTIVEVDPGKSMKQKLLFTAPMKAENEVFWTFEESTPGVTKVTWTNKGKSDYPVGRFFGVMMDKMIGPDFERGLSKLKILCEKQ